MDKCTHFLYILMTIYCLTWNWCWKNLISTQMTEHVTWTAQFHASVTTHTCIMWPPTCFRICINSWFCFTEAFSLKWCKDRNSVEWQLKMEWCQYLMIVNIFINHWQTYKTYKRSIWVKLYPLRAYSWNNEEKKVTHIFPFCVRYIFMNLRIY